MKTIILFLSAIIFTNYSIAQTFNWAYSAGGSDWDDVKSSHLGNDNGTVVTGMYSGTANFGTTTLTSLAYQDAFVAKYDEFGNVLWAKAISGADEQDWGYKVTTDNNNNVLVTGYFQSTSLKFTLTDSIVKSSLSSRNAFVAKYSSTGVFQWAKLLHGGVTSAFITATSITTDNNNNVIVSGQYNKQVFCDGVYLPNTTSSNIFMYKFNAGGSIVWSKVGTSSAQCWFADMTCDATNNIYATGKISKAITFGTITSPQVSGDQMAIAKFDSAGAMQWIKLYGDSLSGSTSDNNFDCGASIKLDASNNIFVGGSILDTFYFDVINNVLVRKQFACITKYNNAGVQLWMHLFGDDEKNVINAIDLDANGDVYAIGSYRNICNIGGTALPTDMNTSSFVAKFGNANGNTIFAYKNGSNSNESQGIGIGVHQGNGNVYTLGNYKNSIGFNNTISAVGIWDMYISLLNNAVAPSSISSITKSSIWQLYPNPTSNVLNISSNNNTQNAIVTIYNFQGQPIASHSFQLATQIDVHNLKPGNYIVSILQDGKRENFSLAID